MCLLIDKWGIVGIVVGFGPTGLKKFPEKVWVISDNGGHLCSYHFGHPDDRLVWVD